MIRYAALAILLSGCAGLLPSAQMSAEQLNAIAKDSWWKPYKRIPK